MPSQSPANTDLSNTKPSLVPIGVTYGLAAFAVVLALAGYGFRLALGETFDVLWRPMLLTLLEFCVLLPVGFMVGAWVMNRISGRAPIQMRNAATLGLLFSCVAMLWLMSVYS